MDPRPFGKTFLNNISLNVTISFLISFLLVVLFVHFYCPFTPANFMEKFLHFLRTYIYFYYFISPFT